jgi:hypothetical protein
MSHMTYGRETRDTKTVVRERVKVLYIERLSWQHTCHVSEGGLQLI